jgi:mycoredoxin
VTLDPDRSCGPDRSGDGDPSRDATDVPVTVYWRPGCGFCSALLRGLERSGLRFDRVDIWQDENGARFVRSVADGNETVPTVRVVDVALVNPSTGDVLREVQERAPEQLPDGLELPEPGRLARAVTRLLGG